MFRCKAGGDDDDFDDDDDDDDGCTVYREENFD